MTQRTSRAVRAPGATRATKATKATKAIAADPEADALPLHPHPRPTRGRHRKPRPRRMLFAVGGLALAAGALSFVRLVPESVGGGGAGVTEAEPRAANGVSEGATNTAATMKAARPPEGSAGPGRTTAHVVVGSGPSPRTTTGATPSSGAMSPGPTPPHAQSPGIPTPPATKAPATTAPAAPRPTQSTAAPAPRPGHPDERDQRDDRGLCLPVIKLCLT
ncbi:hypothetical protein [Streptomyces acidicola]|uniref:hypothetical protein n=1 Tax=Streptomyces acidicola TaxID=2596892 RepID=UPI0034322A12